MNRKGFVIPIFLITICVMMITAMYLSYITVLESNITVASKDKIQAQYLIETKLNRAFSDADYYEKLLKPAIVNHLKFPTQGFQEVRISIDDKDLDPYESKDSINVLFFNKNGRKHMELSSISSYMGINTELKKCSTVINHLFERGSLPLISYDLDFDTIVMLDKFYKDLKTIEISNLSSDIKVINTYDHDRIIIKTKNFNNNELTKIRNNTEDSININKSNDKNIFLYIENKIFTPVVLEIKEGPQIDPLTLSGIIYLDGDLVISGRFNFTGIIILKGQNSKIIVQTDYKPTIRGILLTEGSTDFQDKVNLIYDAGAIGKYGVYLPGFIDPKIE